MIDNGPGASTDPLKPDYNIEPLRIPDFELVDQDGRPVTQEAFKNNVTVVSFFFTRCTFICPALTGATIGLTQKLKDTPVRFLSISVDPENDTPEVIKKYAADHSADPARWSFLTGKKDVVWSMLRSGLKWGIEERPEERIMFNDGSSMSNIRHPGWFALVGPDGRVLAVYQASEDEKLEQLMARARSILRVMKKTG